jgi:hypothetical protein
MLNKIIEILKYKFYSFLLKNYFNKQFEYKIKIIIFLFLILIMIINKNININIKVALCTMEKNENLYIKEFISYYIKLGIDKIIIYDDNDLKYGKISDIIDFEFKKYVKIYETKKLNISGQSQAFTDCYEKYKSMYNWMLMIDMDEYLYIKKDTLKNYLLKPVFNKCDFIKFQWVIPTDNNHLYYENKPLFERFKGPYINSIFIKSIIRGNISRLKYWVHSPSISPERNTSCNNIGKKINTNNINFEFINKIDTKKAFIIHFEYKSTEEFIKKIKRGYSNWFVESISTFLRGKINGYLTNNKVTKQKIDYLEKELNLNLSEYRRIVNKII